MTFPLLPYVSCQAGSFMSGALRRSARRTTTARADLRRAHFSKSRRDSCICSSSPASGCRRSHPPRRSVKAALPRAVLTAARSEGRSLPAALWRSVFCAYQWGAQRQEVRARTCWTDVWKTPNGGTCLWRRKGEPAPADEGVNKSPLEGRKGRGQTGI